MGFQYDIDDLGYEWGYDKPSNIPSETTQNFMDEGDSPKVVYECQVACPPGQIPVRISTDPTVAPICEEPKKEVASADKKADEKKDASKAGFQKAAPKPESTGRQAPKAGEHKDTPAKPAAAAGKPPAPAKAEAGSAEAAKKEALRDPKYKTLQGHQSSNPASALVAFLNSQTNTKGWGGRPGPEQNGKQTYEVVHKIDGVVDNNTMVYTGDKGGDSTQWTLVTKTPQPSTAELAAETSKITAAKAAGEKALTGLTDKAKVKEKLENEDFKVEEKDVSEKDKTITVKATKDGQSFTFEIKDGVAKNTYPPTPSGSKSSKPDHSWEEMKDKSGVQQLRGHLGNDINDAMFTQWWDALIKPELDQPNATLDKVLVKAKNYFDEAHQRGVSGKEFVRGQLATVHVKAISEKLGSIQAGQKALEARGFKTEVNSQGKYKIIGREQINGKVVPLSDEDIKELTDLTSQVTQNPTKFKADTERWEVIRNYVDQAPSDKDKELAWHTLQVVKDKETGKPYLDQHFRPTNFKIESFRSFLVKGFAPGKESPTLQELSPFSKVFVEYQNEFQFLENSRRGLIQAKPNGRTEESINKEYSERKANLKISFNKKMQMALDSADPLTRAYVQKQLKEANYPQADWKPEKFAETVVAPAFTATVQDYQKALEANAAAAQQELSHYSTTPENQGKISEIKQKYAQKEADLKKQFDGKIHDQVMSADSVTLKYITEKLKAAGYYTKTGGNIAREAGVTQEADDKFAVADQWTKNQREQFIKDISAPRLPNLGVANLPNRAKLTKAEKELEKLKGKVEKESAKYPDDADKLDKVVKDSEAHLEKIQTKLDPVSKTLFQQTAGQVWVDQVAHKLQEAGYGDAKGEQVRGLLSGWGLTDSEGRALPNLDPVKARAKLQSMVDVTIAKGQDRDILKTGMRTDAIQKGRENLAAALKEKLHLSPKEMRAYAYKSGYLGIEEHLPDNILLKMRKDIEEIEKAKEAEINGDSKPIKELEERYKKVGGGKEPPEGDVEGDQAQIFAPGFTDEELKTRATKSQNHEKEISKLDEEIKNKEAKRDDKGTSEADKAKLQNDINNDRRAKAKLSGRNAGEDVQVARDRLAHDKLQAARKNELDRTNLFQQKEEKVRERLFQKDQAKKNRDAEMDRTLIQAFVSILTALIGMVGQIMSAQISSLAGVLNAILQSHMTGGGRGR